MKAARGRFLVVAAVAATLAVGLVGVPAAYADGGLTVTPATGLADGQAVSLEISGFTPSAAATLQFALCGNAYADNTSLPAPLSVVPGTLDGRNCQVIRFTSPGDITTSPFTVTDAIVPQHGIGSGNRSCIDPSSAAAPCFIYVSTSVNLPPFPLVPIDFAAPAPAGGARAATTSTVMAIGSPVASGSTEHALVTVAPVDVTNPPLIPEGDVEVFEGATSLGTGTLGADGTANVALGVLGSGSHDLTAHFAGSGSFLASDAGTATLSVINASNISIGDISVVEGNSTGPHPADMRTVTFPIVLSRPSPTAVSVNYTIVPTGTNPATVGLATASGTDVVGATGVISFRALKQTAKYLNVRVLGDTTNEGDETFAVQLSNPVGSGYVLRDSEGEGTILDDDAPTAGSPTVGVGSAAIPEGNLGNARAMKFTISLSAPSATDTVVTLQMSNITATRGTKATGDWGGAINKSMRILAGTVGKSLVVPVFADQRDELDETMRVRILGVSSGVSLGTHTEAIGTILSDE
jgi:hypothetical protein